MGYIAQDKAEEDFLAKYDASKFPPVAVSVDVAALTIRDHALCVLAVERAEYPYKEFLALPGAFPSEREDTYVAAIRGLVNKTNVSPPFIEQLGTYGTPDRDPRMRVFSVAYVALGPFDDEPKAGYHATAASWFPVNNPATWAFDHARIIGDAVRRVQSKMEYTSVATRFLPNEFTIPELMDVYSIVWGEPIDKGNFYRKVKATSGFIVETGEKRGSAALYRAGKAKMLYPPIRREAGDWA